MSDLTIRRVSTRAEKKRFLQLPWKLYKGDPNWIPPIRTTQKELVGYRYHPFYDRNCIQTFLACRGREVCGRIAGILNQGHNLRYKERRGFFGFFECVDDQQVADALFDAVRQWFADQDVYCLRGPTNPSQNHELGLLIDGFDTPPFFMMTYNPPYYERLIEGYGFRKAQDLYAYWGHADILPEINARLEPIIEQIIARYGVRLRSLDTTNFLGDVEMFLSVFNRSMDRTWGFVPMSRAELRHVAKGLRHLIVPELTVAAEIDGKVVGATFGMPDYNPRIKHIDGRLFPFGFLHLLRKKCEIKKIRVISTNVIPEYQRTGVGLTLLSALVPKAMEWKLEEAEFSWVLESNSLSRGSLEKGGAKITKTYRLYDLDCKRAEEENGPRPTAKLLGCRSILAAGGRLEIRRVETAADLDQFIKVPWKIYADDPHWVPPLLLDVKEFLDRRKHPFYKHGAATQFIASRGGVPLGRILVSDDPLYNEQHNTNVGCFGMFECIDDRQMAAALLDSAAGWLLDRGRSHIMGPIDYSTNYPCGLLIEGFDSPPRVMMNHGRPHYGRLLESWGLAKAKDLYAWWFEDSKDMIDRWSRRAERLAKRGGITIRPFRKKDFDADVRRCKDVYNSAMQSNWGFVKLTDAEFQYMAKRMAQSVNIELVLLAEVDERPVGFSITLPDINEAIQPLNGRLTNYGMPINLARFLHRIKRVKTARMVVLNVVEKYRRRGIAELLIMRTLDYGKNTVGYTGAELGWTTEDNDMINKTVETVGSRHYKTYRIYEKSLGE